MSETIVTYCDMCNLAQSMDNYIEQVNPFIDGATVYRVRGVFMGPTSLAVERDWQLRYFGAMCPDCVLEEQAQAELDAQYEAETVVGLPEIKDDN